MLRQALVFVLVMGQGLSYARIWVTREDWPRCTR